MVDERIIEMVREYLNELISNGLKIKKAYIYGSYARGTATEESDIDLLLIAPEFDEKIDEYLPLIWLSTRKSNYKIEPVPIGEKKFNENESSPLIESVRNEGFEVAA